MLLDTSGLLCLHDEHDRRHGDANAFYRIARDHVTTSYVLAEFVALANTRRLPRARALDFLTDLTNNPTVEVIWVASRLHGEALRLLQQRLDET